MESRLGGGEVGRRNLVFVYRLRMSLLFVSCYYL